MGRKQPGVSSVRASMAHYRDTNNQKDQFTESLLMHMRTQTHRLISTAEISTFPNVSASVLAAGSVSVKQTRGFVATVVKKPISQLSPWHLRLLWSEQKEPRLLLPSLSHSLKHITAEVDPTLSALFGFMWPDGHGLLAVLMSLVCVRVEVTITGILATCLSPPLGSDDTSFPVCPLMSVGFNTRVLKMNLWHLLPRLHWYCVSRVIMTQWDVTLEKQGTNTLS